MELNATASGYRMSEKQIMTVMTTDIKGTFIFENTSIVFVQMLSESGRIGFVPLVSKRRT